MKTHQATITLPGKTRQSEHGEYVSAKAALSNGEEVWVNASHPEGEDGQALLAVRKGQRVTLAEKTGKTGKVSYALCEDGAGGDGVEDAPRRAIREKAPADVPPRRTDAAVGGAPGVSAEIAQIRLVAADVLNEAAAQGKTLSVEQAIPIACAIWTKRQIEALLWQHGVPGALQG
jgi:hypothetical protein